MSNNSSLPIIAVGALGLSSISCVISSFTGFLVSGDSNVESNTSTSNTSTSNTSTDTSNTSTDTSNTSTSNTSTSNTNTDSEYTIPHQIPSGTDGWCIAGTDSVHQDVPGCGRICSSAINVGSKRDGTWGPWADNTTVSSTCVGAKLDEIWEVQDDGSRKLADGYIVSTFGKPSYFEEGVDYTIKGGRVDPGKYCSNDNTKDMICDRDVASGWEKFQFTYQGDNKYAIKSMRTDKHCKDNMENVIKCDTDHIAGHEKFLIEKHGDKYSIKGGWGDKYCSDQSVGLVCNTDHLQGWEKFTITKA